MQINWLEGVRILDLTTAWAGPAVGRFLGALGADVVKVESARRYDIWRGPANKALGRDGDGGYSYNQAPNFNGLNRNKRAISLELTTEQGREVYRALVARADAMVANFSARVLPNLGLEFEDLVEINPRIILLNMPSLGASGPYKDLAGYGTIIEGLGGLASRFGYRDEGARVSQTFFPDGVAGIHASLALLAALKKRDATGRGLRVDLSQQETMWMQLGEAIVMSSRDGKLPARMGNGEPRCVPSGVFRAADRWLAIVVAEDSEFQSLCRVTKPHLDAYAEMKRDERVRHRAQIESRLAEWLAARPAETTVADLNRAGIRAACVNDYGSGASSPELNTLEMFEEVDHAEVGPKRYLRIPIRFDGAPITTRRPGVRFSEHTDEVLMEWIGLTPAELQHLRDTGVIVDEIPIGNGG